MDGAEYDEMSLLSESKDELDAEEYIDYTFNMLKAKRLLEAQPKDHTQEDIKNYINKTTHKLDSKTGKESFYEHDLIKTYKERIYFLENQVSRLTGIIENFVSLKEKTLESPPNEQTQQRNNKNSRENSLIPDAPTIDTLHNDTDINTNTLIESIDDQLCNVRKNNHKKYLQNKKSCKSVSLNLESNQKSFVDDKDKRETCMIFSDSMFIGIDNKSASKGDTSVKVYSYSGAKTENIKEKVKDLIPQQKPDVVMLHVGTNNAPSMTSNAIVDDILSIKYEVKKLHPSCRVIVSTPIMRSDDGKANLTIKKINDHLKQLKIDIMDNDNINAGDLGRKGLHLSKKGKAKLTKNVLNKLNFN